VRQCVTYWFRRFNVTVPQTRKVLVTITLHGPVVLHPCQRQRDPSCCQFLVLRQPALDILHDAISTTCITRDKEVLKFIDEDFDVRLVWREIVGRVIMERSNKRIILATINYGPREVGYPRRYAIRHEQL